jgi:anaerobic magnesium-protoporphyrin IX monomethyl ester cyclase
VKLVISVNHRGARPLTTHERFTRIACVQLDARLPDFCTQVIMPRYGLPLIGSLLQQAGYEVRVFIEHVAPPDLDWVLGADVILFSALTGAANRTYELARWLRQRTKAPLIIGGEHASSFTDDALDWFDYAVRREGDGLILDLIHALEEHGRAEGLPGISYRAANGQKVHPPPGPVPRELDAVQDLGIIHGYPREDGLRLLLSRRKAKIICVQATRGCPYHCSFCVTPRLFGFSYRFRDVEAVIDDIRRKLPYGREFLFVDNLFALNKAHTLKLLDRMIEEGIGERAEFTCFCRVEIGDNPEMLERMHRAGIRTICLGLESINDQTLQSIDKRQSLEDTVRAIHAIQRAGIHVSGSFLAGAEADTRESLLATVDFVIEHGLRSFFYISLWYYPGDPRSPLIPQREIMTSFDYLTGHFVTHFPALMKPSTLQRTLVDAQRRFWSLSRAARFAARGQAGTALHLAAHRYAFTEVERHQLEYAASLEAIEDGYYDSGERLLMDRILQRELDPIVKRGLESGVVALDTLPGERPGRAEPDLAAIAAGDAREEAHAR